jgi:hypothetical protein
MALVAVITGDIIGFTGLDITARQQLIEATTQLMKSWVDEPANAEIFRGDSFQLLLDDPQKAIRRAIQLICWFRQQETADTQLSCRLSVGIGQVSYRGKSVLDSDGSAFHYSGRAFDKMEIEELLHIQTGNERRNELFAVILIFINAIISHWTPQQAAAIFLALEDCKQLQIAEGLSISQGAVNSRLKAARWKEVKAGTDYIAANLNLEL